MKKVYIIVGSARPHWLGRQIAKWVRAVGKKHTSAAMVVIDAEDFDVIESKSPTRRRWVRGQPLPNKTYKLEDADGYIFITPEYKKGTSEVMQTLLKELEGSKSKPVAFVAYGQQGGFNVVETLRKKVRSLNQVPLRKSVHIAKPWESLSAEGEVHDSLQDKELTALLKQLSGWMAIPNPSS